MSIYFLVLDDAWFHGRIAPVLAECWRRRNFAPARGLTDELGIDQPAAFDKSLWRLLVGEVLLKAAIDVPEFQTAPETLAALVGGSDVMRRAHFGTRDVILGGFYRPDQARYNTADDVRELAASLDGFDPSSWSADGLVELAGPDPEDQADELEFARGCFADLHEMYRQTAMRGRVIVCEVL